MCIFCNLLFARLFVGHAARKYREGSVTVRYAESSMRNGFGLKFIHKFFNLPYLQLQRAALLKQLETNQSESEISHQELDLYAESDEANYDL